MTQETKKPLEDREKEIAELREKAKKIPQMEDYIDSANYEYALGQRNSATRALAIIDSLLAENSSLEASLAASDSYVEPCKKLQDENQLLKEKLEIAQWSLMDLRNNFDLDTAAQERIEKCLEKINQTKNNNDK